MQRMDRDALLDSIRSLWSSTLGLAPGDVHADSHFLLLGGDSLQLARLLGRVQAELGVELPLHELVRFATPARMAACCRGVQAGQRAAAGTSMGPSLPCTVPATEVQQGIWLAAQLAAPGTLYLASVLVHLRGPLDLHALRQAHAALLQRHPLLLAQLAPDPATRRLLLHLQAASVAGDERGLQLQECTPHGLHGQVDLAVHRPVSFAAGSLCRMQLFRLAAAQHALLVSCHHAISDGWSGGILLAQLAELYAQARQYGSLPPQPADLRFIAHCQQVAAVETSADAPRMQYWRQRLAGAEQAQEWLWEGRAAEPWPHQVQSLTVPVPSSLLNQLRRRAQASRHSLFTLFLHAVRAGLYDCSGVARQVLLLPVARRRPDEENSIGCFIAPVLLAGVWHDGRDTEAALQQEAQDHAAARRELVPLATLATLLRPRLLPDGNPWSSILFAFQNFPQPPLQWPGLEHNLEAVADRASQYALKLEVLCGEHWQLRLEFATALLDVARVEALATAILARLQALGQP